MAITDDNLESSEPHSLGGEHRTYRYGKRFTLSVVNTPMAHSYPFAWEVAVAVDGCLHYGTALTNDVEVFMNDEDTDAFIAKAKAYFATDEAAALPDNSNATKERRAELARLADDIRNGDI